jgi:hypothetical protein
LLLVAETVLTGLHGTLVALPLGLQTQELAEVKPTDVAPVVVVLLEMVLAQVLAHLLEFHLQMALLVVTKIMALVAVVALAAVEDLPTKVAAVEVTPVEPTQIQTNTTQTSLNTVQAPTIMEQARITSSLVALVTVLSQLQGYKENIDAN